MIKLPPSLVGTYDLIYSSDDALDRPADSDQPELADGETAAAFRARYELWAGPYVEWERKLKVARETGDWTALLIPGQEPTRFKIRQVPAEVWTKVDSVAKAEGWSNTERVAWLFRLFVVDVTNVPADRGWRMTRTRHPKLGDVAGVELVNLFTGVELVMVEIVEAAAERRSSLPGK